MAARGDASGGGKRKTAREFRDEICTWTESVMSVLYDVERELTAALRADNLQATRQSIAGAHERVLCARGYLWKTVELMTEALSPEAITKLEAGWRKKFAKNEDSKQSQYEMREVAASSSESGDCQCNGDESDGDCDCHVHKDIRWED